MSDVSTRSSIGTRIGDAVGGAVRAATSAGDLMLEPAIQLTTAESTTSARTKEMVWIRFLLIIASIY
jgi:hypothetical protein